MYAVIERNGRVQVIGPCRFFEPKKWVGWHLIHASYYHKPTLAIEWAKRWANNPGSTRKEGDRKIKTSVMCWEEKGYFLG